MTKTDLSANQIKIKSLIQDIKAVCDVPVQKLHQKLVLEEYPFDHQLLSLSSIYRKSRQSYLKLGGKFQPRVCSTMRA